MRITKKETAQWIDCIANDKRIPKDVRKMCADIVLRLRFVNRKRRKK